jgi:hypothetical protein
MDDGRQVNRVALLVLLLAGVCTGCSSVCAPLPGGARDTVRPFADVPPPAGGKLVWSYVYETGSYRYGSLMFKSRADTGHIVDEYKRLMPREDWLYADTLSVGDTILRYTKKAKPAEHCDIVIGTPNWLGSRYVIVTVTGSHRK